MKILCFDLETLPMVLHAWGLKQDGYISHENIIEESTIICGSWMFVDIDKKANSVSILDCPTRFNKSVYDDYHVVKKLHKVLSEDNIVPLGQNSDNFDVKLFNWRAKQHKLPPITFPQTIDTLKESRKVFRPPSHRLDYKNKQLGHGGKIHMDNKNWLDITQYSYPRDGDKRDKELAIKAVETMVAYNKRDVEATIENYLEERGYYKKHPNRLLYDPLIEGCPTCGGKDFVKKGLWPTTTMVYQRYICRSPGCGKQFRGTESLHRVGLK